MSEHQTNPNPAGTHDVAANHLQSAPDSNSAVSWAAIFAGAAGSVALSLLLLILGSGLGLSVLSPWSLEASAATVGFAAIAWLTFTQLAASGMGGYLAGRLRTKWPGVKYEEVYFRDTAHGLLTWAVATLLMVALTAMVAGSIVSGGVRAGAAVADGAASTVGTVGQAAAGSGTGGDAESTAESDTIEYFVDSLFRGTSYEAQGEVSEIPVAEVTRIFTRAITTGELPRDDKQHLGRLIAQRTDLNQAQAEQRVSNVFEEVESTLDELKVNAREAAEEAGKASALAALWITVSLLIGAFPPLSG